MIESVTCTLGDILESFGKEKRSKVTRMIDDAMRAANCADYEWKKIQIYSTSAITMKAILNKEYVEYLVAIAIKVKDHESEAKISTTKVAIKFFGKENEVWACRKSDDELIVFLTILQKLRRTIFKED